ncbi:MAG: transcriptional coactivator p15/PC4 family protein [Candidatus Gastranaerophilales bacterium]|nr:transcriptional coactivator p15/PC4 family protein [Candidatus Gastranaerophilales bacterium]
MTTATEPKLLATIPRNATEQLQIGINSYKGKSYLDMRIYYTTDDGATWNPTKKGVTVSPDNLDLLKDAIEEAKKELMSEENAE